MLLLVPLLCLRGVGDVVRCDLDLVEDVPGVIPPGEFGVVGHGLLDQDCLGY